MVTSFKHILKMDMLRLKFESITDVYNVDENESLQTTVNFARILQGQLQVHESFRSDRWRIPSSLKDI